MVMFNVVQVTASRALGLTIVILGLALTSVSSTWATEPCPNEQVRSEDSSTQLPDCRAYEMVSPAYTEGFNVHSPGIVIRPTSVAGPGLEFGAGIAFGSSFGVFAGAENTGISPVGGNYRFARTPSGWSTSPFDPPFTRFPDTSSTQPLLSADLLSSIWELGTSVPGSTARPNRDYYLRNPAGAYAIIGPSTPSGTTIGLERFNVLPEELGASGDLSHLLFTSTDEVEGEAFWPGDNTILEDASLYEYMGTNNTAPTMVGVRGGAGSHELIGQCGTSLGGNAGSNQEGLDKPTYNAVSASGGTVFFSVASGGCFGLNPRTGSEELGQGPPVRELYARVDGEETVAISEPTVKDCSECQEGTPKDASFQAASADGSKVLFTTTQPLLPADTDSTSDLYEYDFNAPEGHRIIQISAGGSDDPTPGAGAGVQGLATVSPSLSYVYFVATGVLTTTRNAQGQEAKAGSHNLYVYEPDAAHPGQSKTIYIATLEPSDSSDWAGFSIHDQNSVEVTPDGRFLLFASTAHLTPGDTSSASQLFQYNAETGTLTRISICQAGYECNDNGSVAVGTGRREQSMDGAYVFFNSTVPLAPQAAASPGFSSVYEYHNGNIYLISDGRDTTGFAASDGSELFGVSPSGSDVYFTTGDFLLSSDTNTQVGIYDARKEGGFPLPTVASACKEEVCQGEPPGGLVTPSSASATLSGTGNVATPPPPPAVVKRATTKAMIKCSKRAKLSHGKCVKKKRRAKKATKKAGSVNRKASK